VGNPWRAAYFCYWSLSLFSNIGKCLCIDATTKNVCVHVLLLCLAGLVVSKKAILR
jgi:hypothetical protein